MFDDIIDSSISPWKRNGALNEWYYIGRMDIRLNKRTGMIYDLYYCTSNKVNVVKIIIGTTDESAQNKAEKFLKNNNII